MSANRFERTGHEVFDCQRDRLFNCASASAGSEMKRKIASASACGANPVLKSTAALTSSNISNGVQSIGTPADIATRMAPLADSPVSW